MKQKATLVLGGGSALGLAHIGVLSVLEEQFEISGIIGTSMGAIIGCLYALGMTPKEILNIAKRHRNAWALSPFNLDRHVNGIFDGKFLYKLYLDWTKDTRIEDCKFPFIAVAYDLISRSTILFDKGSCVDALRASSSLPLIFAPYKLGEYMLVDGGIEHPLPLAFASLLPSERVIAVNVLPWVEKKARFITLPEAENAKPKRNPRTEVVMQAILHNQAYLSLKDINIFAPDIVIDAAMQEGRPFAFHKAQAFYEYGIKQAINTLADYGQPRFLAKIRVYYRKLISQTAVLSMPEIETG